MSTLAERFKEAIGQRKIKLKDLAIAAGVQPPSVSDWLNGETLTLKAETAIKAANFLGVNALWLASGVGTMRGQEADAQGTAAMLQTNTEPGPDIRGYVPLISWVQAGAWNTIIDNLAPGDAEEWLPCPKRFGPHAFALRVRGLSMEPRYQAGDIIFVDPDARAEHGKHVVVRLDDEREATFKQLVVEGGQRFLRALNPDWPGPKLILIEGNATICGVVIGKWVPE